MCTGVDTTRVQCMLHIPARCAPLDSLPTTNYTSAVSFWCTPSTIKSCTCAYLVPGRTGQQANSTLDLNLRKKPVKCYIQTEALRGAETWAPGK
jgi:hypothetical protein